MQISISPLTPNRSGMSPKEAWSGPDAGIIRAWEAGRDLAEKDEKVAQACLRGELPPLPYSGGYAKATKQGEAYAPMHYLAMWHGLRGEGLELNTENETSVTCAKTGMVVTFTTQPEKYVVK